MRLSSVLAQREMEKERSPFSVDSAPAGRGFFKA